MTGFEKGGTGAAGIGAEIAVGMALAKDLVHPPAATTPTKDMAGNSDAATRRRCLVFPKSMSSRVSKQVK